MMPRHPVPSRTTLYCRGLLALAVILCSFAPAGAATKLSATVIDVFGNRHELENIKILGKTNVEYYVGTTRRVVSVKDIDRFRFDGERGDEERPIRVEFRDRRIETGTIVLGADSTPHHESLGGGRLSSQLSGSTNLGPFLLQLGDVREVIFQHPESSKPKITKSLSVTLVDEHGTLYEVENLNFRDKTDLVFKQGRKRRRIDMSKIAKIAFAEASSGQEQRPITITMWSGKTVQGDIDAGRARISGETDRMFHLRIGSAFTGETGAGPFAIGLHNVRLVMFRPAPGAPDELDTGGKGAGGNGVAGIDSAPSQADQPPD